VKSLRKFDNYRLVNRAKGPRIGLTAEQIAR
jgi:hypothetical protein